MTVIVYHHESGQLAYDSRMTIGDCIVSDAYEKLKQHDGRFFIGAGETYSLQECYQSYPSRPDSGNIQDCSFLMFEDGVCYYITFHQKDGFKKLAVDYDFTLGSGEAHAITALDMGASAVKAVEMAIKRCTGCGGRINVKNMRKEK